MYDLKAIIETVSQNVKLGLLSADGEGAEQDGLKLEFEENLHK